MSSYIKATFFCVACEDDDGDDAFTGSSDQSETERLIRAHTLHHRIMKLISRDSVSLLEVSYTDTHTHTALLYL